MGIDVSIADRFCLKRTKLINEILCHYEGKFGLPMKRLIVFIKHWSKVRMINNSYKCYLNSYAYTLLIIKFIQHLLDDNKHIIYFNKSLSFFVFSFFEFYLFKFDISKHEVAIFNPFEAEKNEETSMSATE